MTPECEGPLGPPRPLWANGAIRASLRVEATTKYGSVWGELPTITALAANVSLRVGRGLVNSPTVTDHSAENRPDSHPIRVTGRRTLAWSSVLSPEPG
jgi:hypothetical protein